MRNALLGLMMGSALVVPASLSAGTCGAKVPDAKDELAASPDFYKVLIDNETIRVVDVNMPPGAKDPEHSQVWSALVIADTQRPGQIPAVRDFRSSWEPAKSKVEGGNPTTQPYHALRIELKKGDCKPVKNPPLPSTDGVTIHDPKIRVPFENAYVRVLEIEVIPGEAEPPHTHTWPSVVYYYRLPSSRRGTADGKPAVDRPELTAQQVTFENFPAALHTLLNTGTYLYQAHRIEIKPVKDK